jgi:hypothetical protein
MRPLSSADEQQLLDGVKQAVDLVDNQGMSPNAAMQKVARALNYSPGFLKAACNAFNTGRQLAQWNANDSVLDKLAGFPLADYDAIHNAMWGTAQEKVAQVLYTEPRFSSYDDLVRQESLDKDLATFTKTAAAEPVVAARQLPLKRAYDAVDYNQRLQEEARRAFQAEREKLAQHYQVLTDYFAKSAYDRLPFGQVAQAVNTYYGPVGAALIRSLAAQFPQEKQAAYQTTNACDRTKAPYPAIAATLQQVERYKQAETALDLATNQLTEAQAAYDQLKTQVITKQASSAAFGGGFGLGLVNSIAADALKDRDKKIENQINELESPDHINEMRKIRAQTLLTQLMSDPENPLSAYDPEEVLSEYNQMVQLSPRLADQPAAVGPLLNKRLTGNTEPFELGQMLDLENKMQSIQPSPGYGKASQNSLFGSVDASSKTAQTQDLIYHETSILG